MCTGMHVVLDNAIPETKGTLIRFALQVDVELKVGLPHQIDNSGSQPSSDQIHLRAINLNANLDN